MTISLLLLICAAVCFLLACIPVAVRVNLVALGLLFITLATLLGGSVLALHG